MNATTLAENVDQNIKVIVDRLPEDQGKLTEIEEDVDHANSNVRTSEINVQQVLKLVPDVTDILSRLSGQAMRMRQLGLDLKTSLMLLRNNVSVARDEANLVSSVAMLQRINFMLTTHFSISDFCSLNLFSSK